MAINVFSNIWTTKALFLFIIFFGKSVECGAKKVNDFQVLLEQQSDGNRQFLMLTHQSQIKNLEEIEKYLRFGIRAGFYRMQFSWIFCGTFSSKKFMEYLKYQMLFHNQFGDFLRLFDMIFFACSFFKFPAKEATTRDKRQV